MWREGKLSETFVKDLIKAKDSDYKKGKGDNNIHHLLSTHSVPDVLQTLLLIVTQCLQG